MLKNLLDSVEALVFDLDGVIADTAKFHYEAWKRLLEDLGFQIDPNESEQLKGVGRIQALETLLTNRGIDFPYSKKVELAERKNAYYVKLLSLVDEGFLLPGGMEFVSLAKKRGYKTALATASKNAHIILNKTRICSYFDVIVDGTMVKRTKPDPEIFLLTAKRLKAKPEKCVVFEDAYAGIEGAKKAGMKCIGIGKPEVLSNADFVVDSLASAVKMFGNEHY
ncbi:MAG: beta-phosphoglucomutase [Kosmotoga sp.]|uniref:beta-phosphoglucomutase n=1 Tax=Kosmotoga sp. TaxID=1955248 RepID=UPI0025B966A2|nr:beta-phosphoglucomutase [Kosmotoga sp.]MCD6160313.1 beta-phosphoglucomutase [Kosmotoga sp.]